MNTHQGEGGGGEKRVSHEGYIIKLILPAQLTPHYLQSVKSQRATSGYRSDSVLGPSDHKKRNHRSVDKISNLHKSTENLKTNYVELASFGPPPHKPAGKAYNSGVKHTPPSNGVLGNGSHGNGSHGNSGTQKSEHAYANLPTHYNTAPSNHHVNNG